MAALTSRTRSASSPGATTPPGSTSPATSPSSRPSCSWATAPCTGAVRINSSRLLYTVGAGASAASGPWGRGLPIGGPFFLSESRSSVALVGCGAQVQLRGGDDESLIASCAAVCPLDGDGQIVAESSGACAGVGCCQASIVLGYDSYLRRRGRRQCLRLLS